jgi:hypothetical protein
LKVRQSLKGVADRTVEAPGRAFDDPILLPGRRELGTLRDADDYIIRPPKAEQNLAEWQAAVEALLVVVELNGPMMMARISIMKALNRGYVREFNSSQGHALGPPQAKARNMMKESKKCF